MIKRTGRGLWEEIKCLFADILSWSCGLWPPVSVGELGTPCSSHVAWGVDSQPANTLYCWRFNCSPNLDKLMFRSGPVDIQKQLLESSWAAWETYRTGSAYHSFPMLHFLFFPFSHLPPLCLLPSPFIDFSFISHLPNSFLLCPHPKLLFLSLHSLGLLSSHLFSPVFLFLLSFPFLSLLLLLSLSSLFLLPTT